jgi:hypothetical protein
LSPALKGYRAGVIYSRLFKYTQQHTAGCYREPLGPTPPKAGLYVIVCHGVFILYLNVLLLAQITHNGMWAICHHFASVVYNYFTFEFPFLSVPTPGPLHLSLLERKWSGVVFSQSENIVWFRDIRRHQLKLWRVTLSRNKQKPNMLLICELEKKISSLNHSNYSCMIIQFLW